MTTTDAQEHVGAIKIPTQLFPIAEIFESPQGEALWQGTLCTFVRLAGCTVGKPYSREEREANIRNSGTGPVLHLYQEKCTSWNGESFACDTNYRMTEKMSIGQLLEATKDAVRICLTGGEPLMHDVKPLILAWLMHGKYVHIETSGTKPLDGLKELSKNGRVWITVSPKQGYMLKALAQCDEIKVLIGEGFDEGEFLKHFAMFIPSDKVWIQPINDEHEIRRDNMVRCLELQKKHKHLRISSQLHKLWCVR